MSGKQTAPSQIGPDPARVRDNQRRSRARRKEYLQELQSKIQDCERSGVQASLEIQVAARAVSAENASLKAENSRLIDENQRLRDLLEAPNGGGAKPAYTTTPVEEVVDARAWNIPKVSSEYPSLPEPNDTTQTVEDTLSNVELPKSQTTDATPVPAPQTVSQSSEEPQIQSRAVEIDESMVHPNRTSSQSEQTPHIAMPHTSEELAFGDDTSSCEYAAHIITSMRADISTDDMRADLGCGNDIKEWRKCKVNNSKLFVAVDRYTG